MRDVHSVTGTRCVRGAHIPRMRARMTSTYHMHLARMKRERVTTTCHVHLALMKSVVQHPLIGRECETHVEFDSDDCSPNDSRDTAPLTAGHSKPLCYFDSLVLQPELSFLDDIIVEHFLDMRVFIRRNIPKDFVRSWNSIIVPLMSSIHSDHGMARPDLLDE